MKTINLRDYYYWYTHDVFIEVTDEIAEEMEAGLRADKSHKQQLRRNKSFYSLDTEDGIEASAIAQHCNAPEAILERKERHCRLCCALNSLPEIQGRRIEAHYILGMSQKEIAQDEGVSTEAVRKSIVKGLAGMRKYISNRPIRVGFCPKSEAGI